MMKPASIRTSALLLSAALTATGCVTQPERPAAEPALCLAAQSACPAPTPNAAELEADTRRDQQAAQLQLALLSRDAELTQLRTDLDAVKQRLNDAVLEIVRSKSKMGSLGSRAEAATSLSESELMLSALRRERGVVHDELIAAEKFLALGNTEFKNGNFGGAFYLSSSAKTSLGMVAARVRSAAPAAGEASTEVRFLLPIKLQFTSRSNLRESPRTDSRVLRVAEKGLPVLGISSRDRWVQVEFEDGSHGWSFHDLLGPR